jgi:hypothetical protein
VLLVSSSLRYLSSKQAVTVSTLFANNIPINFPRPQVFFPPFFVSLASFRGYAIGLVPPGQTKNRLFSVPFLSRPGAGAKILSIPAKTLLPIEKKFL